MVEGGSVKHFQGSPREQARGRIVSPHLALASVRASRPLAQPGRVDVRELLGLRASFEPQPASSESLQTRCANPRLSAQPRADDSLSAGLRTLELRAVRAWQGGRRA